jgi:hypothetical protein
MRAKIYLDTPAFIVSCPNQTGGTREEQLLTINNITVTASAINHDFVSSVIDRMVENSTSIQHFHSWRLLCNAVAEFLCDVELDFVHRVAVRLHNSLNVINGYDADSDSEGSILDLPAPSRLIRYTAS